MIERSAYNLKVQTISAKTKEELADVLYNNFHNAEFIPTHDLMLKLPLYKDKKIRYLMENVFNYKGNQRGYVNGKQKYGYKKKK